MSARLQQNPSSRFSRKVDIRKQVPEQEQRQSGVTYRAATKVAAKNLRPKIWVRTHIRFLSLLWPHRYIEKDGRCGCGWDGIRWVQLKLYSGHENLSRLGVTNWRECVWKMSVGLYLVSNLYTTVFVSLFTVKLGSLTNSAISCSKHTCATSAFYIWKSGVDIAHFS